MAMKENGNCDGPAFMGGATSGFLPGIEGGPLGGVLRGTGTDIEWQSESDFNAANAAAIAANGPGLVVATSRTDLATKQLIPLPESTNTVMLVTNHDEFAEPGSTVITGTEWKVVADDPQSSGMYLAASPSKSDTIVKGVWKSTSSLRPASSYPESSGVLDTVPTTLNNSPVSVAWCDRLHESDILKTESELSTAEPVTVDLETDQQTTTAISFPAPAVPTHPNISISSQSMCNVDLYLDVIYSIQVLSASGFPPTLTSVSVSSNSTVLVTGTEILRPEVGETVQGKVTVRGPTIPASSTLTVRLTTLDRGAGSRAVLTAAATFRREGPLYQGLTARIRAELTEGIATPTNTTKSITPNERKKLAQLHLVDVEHNEVAAAAEVFTASTFSGEFTATNGAVTLPAFVFLPPRYTNYTVASEINPLPSPTGSRSHQGEVFFVYDFRTGTGIATFGLTTESKELSLRRSLDQLIAQVQGLHAITAKDRRILDLFTEGTLSQLTRSSINPTWTVSVKTESNLFLFDMPQSEGTLIQSGRAILGLTSWITITGSEVRLARFQPASMTNSIENLTNAQGYITFTVNENTSDEVEFTQNLPPSSISTISVRLRREENGTTVTNETVPLANRTGAEATRNFTHSSGGQVTYTIRRLANAVRTEVTNDRRSLVSQIGYISANWLRSTVTPASFGYVTVGAASGLLVLYRSATSAPDVLTHTFVVSSVNTAGEHTTVQSAYQEPGGAALSLSPLPGQSPSTKRAVAGIGTDQAAELQTGLEKLDPFLRHELVGGLFTSTSAPLISLASQLAIHDAAGALQTLKAP